MKRFFHVSDKALTAYSCMCLIALSKGVPSDYVDTMIYLFYATHSSHQVYTTINGIMKSTFEHAKQALPGASNMEVIT